MGYVVSLLFFSLLDLDDKSLIVKNTFSESTALSRLSNHCLVLLMGTA